MLCKIFMSNYILFKQKDNFGMEKKHLLSVLIIAQLDDNVFPDRVPPDVCCFTRVSDFCSYSKIDFLDWYLYMYPL